MAASDDPEAYARHIGFVKNQWQSMEKGAVEQSAMANAAKKQATDQFACAHRGPETGEVVECKSCRGRVRLKVYDCVVHGRCTIARHVPNVQACCARCPDRSPP